MRLRNASSSLALATTSALLGPPVPAVAAPAELPSRPAAPKTVPARINDVDGDGETAEEKAEDRIGGIRVLFADGKVQTVTRDHLGLPPFDDPRFGA